MRFLSLPPRPRAHVVLQTRVETVEMPRPRKKVPYTFDVTVQGTGSSYPPVVLVPPVGVGIDRQFYSKLLRQFEGLGLPIELHALDLLGCGSAAPLPRRFYGPEIWAEQVLHYVRERVGRPVVVLVQGGMAPVALELWRLGGGRPTVAGVVFMSPPPFQFFAPSAVAEAGDEELPAAKPSRRRPRSPSR